MEERSGVYFLGDDGVYDWASTLLASLRATAPDIEIVCVPFSDRISRLNKLRRRLNFEIFEHPSLGELDELGREHISRDPEFPRVDLAGLFRKLAVFWGPLSKFLYMDADSVALHGFEEFFRKASQQQVQFQYSHSDISQVYRPGALREQMIREFKTHAINSGLWMSRRGVLSIEQVRRAALDARSVVGQLMNLDQPFINYCLDTNRVEMRRFNVPGFECAWPGNAPKLSWTALNETVVRMSWPDGKLVPTMHWAGYRLGPQTPYYDMHCVIGAPMITPTHRLRLRLREKIEPLRESLAGRYVLAAAAAMLKFILPAKFRHRLRKALLPNK